VPTPERDQRGDGGRGDRLVMMTVHLAKGLEFPVVFLAGMEDGLFPSLREREDHDSARALEEERRLAYVAITRAKERLHLSWARTRRVWGQVKLQEPSRFLAEVPAECMARPAARAPSGPPSWQARGWGQGGGGGGGAREAPGRRRRGGDEYDQRPADDEVVYDVDADVRERSGELAPGTLVEHPMFGQGRVIERRGAGKSASVVIDFAAVGRKTIAARFVTAADDGN
jgi:DNA helicase-2/ATP-dependent DNA helicase PcrA